MKCKGKSVPTDKKLYNSLKKKVKARVDVWPSAYASGQLVRQYKSKGGKYSCKFGGNLDRWFKEKWVNVCEPKSPCGKHKKGYPYCRPSKRINKDTPRTIHEISKKTLKRMCQKKRKNPYKKVFVNKKNNSLKYKRRSYFGMNKEPQTCGIGKRRSRFGDNLAPSTSNLNSFYKAGTANSLYPSPNANKCLGGYYGQESLQRFGKKKVNFIQKANKMSEKKGTKGAFIRWCKRKGYPKVTTACINLGKKDKSLRTRRRAIFAQNIHSKYNKFSFGKSKKLSKLNVIEKDIRYLSK